MHIAMIGLKGLPSASGIEQMAEEVGSRLVSAGHTVDAYVRTHFTSGENDVYRGINLVRISSIRSKHMDATVHATASALLCARARPDLVHVHTTCFAPAVCILKAARLPVIVQSHGLDWNREKWGGAAATYLRLSDRISAGLADHLVVVARHLEGHYKGRTQSVTCIPNGASYRSLADSLSRLASMRLAGRRYILFGARLVPEKGCHVLIEAFQRICQHHGDLTLVIAGSDPYNTQYSRNLRRLETERVRFLGAVLGDDYHALLHHCELFVLPSSLEGLSIGLLEAMAAARCVVFSDIPENREAAGDAGLSFHCGDAGDLASRLDEALRDPLLRARMGDRARDECNKRFNWDLTARQFASLYATVAGVRQAAAPIAT